VTSEDERVLVLAPLGRDAELAEAMLGEAGLRAQRCADIAELSRAVGEGAGCALLTEESLTPAAVEALSAALSHQPPWSDFPLVVFGATPGKRANDALRALGNVNLLERPARRRTVIAAVQAALRARRRQYEGRRAIEQRDQFLAMLGHELRNPLGPILFAAELMARKNEPESLAKHRAIIERQARHLARLVDDLLDVSRVTSGKVVLQRSSVDFRALIERAIQAIEPAMRARAQLLSATYTRLPIVVHGDQVRLEQVVNNLLTNACKYTPVGGQISVALEFDAGQAVLSVRDTGMGIEPHMLEMIFELFAQAPRGLDRSQGGMGLGLTLVRSLVTLHGGTVTAESAGAGQGARFVVRLPARAQLLSVPAPRAEPHPSQRLRVVIIDDNADLRETLQAVLESHGHQVATAEDGPTGLQRILAERPDVAIVDVGLPGMSGYEIAAQVRQVMGDGLWLVAMTGYGQPEDRAHAQQAGFDVHLTKPVSGASIIAVLPKTTEKDTKSRRADGS
jgi:signal transduction histidine kinase/ActR/RegA family two-component response regulator